MEIAIRPATEDDYEAVNHVFATELAHHVTLLPDRFQIARPVIPRRWFLDLLADANRRLLVAEVGAQIVGQILIIDAVSMDDPIYRPRRYLDVDELAVLPAYHRRGVGSQLMAAAEAWAARRGIEVIELNVWQANAQAIAFYRQLGYRTIRRRMARQIA